MSQLFAYALPGQVPDIVRWLGAPVDGITVFCGDQTDPSKMAWEAGNYGAAQFPGYPGTSACITLQLVPDDGNLAAANAGDYDAAWASIAAQLVLDGHAGAILRPGHEMNGTWYRWTATGGKEAAYVEAFRRLVGVFRKATGQDFRFCWCPAWGEQSCDPLTCYPGDDVVDYIGQDCYGTTNTSSLLANWDWCYGSPRGISWIVAFAAEHKKPCCFPEWGVMIDDANFVDQMAKLVDDPKNNIAFHGYWMSSASAKCDLRDGSKPKAAAMFVEAFGSPPIAEFLAEAKPSALKIPITGLKTAVYDLPDGSHVLLFWGLPGTHVTTDIAFGAKYQIAALHTDGLHGWGRSASVLGYVYGGGLSVLRLTP